MNTIKAILSDLDGVLLSTKEIHFESLNAALRNIGEEFVISREEHLTIYDGLPTKTKLELLSNNKGLSTMLHNGIFLHKQAETIKSINNLIKPDERMIEIFKKLKSDGYKIYVCTNSIRDTAKLMILRLGLMEYVDYMFTNEDVKHAKPHPEIYLKAMIHAGVKPSEVLIIEDSIHGRQSAVSSGGLLCAVNKPEDVTYELIKSLINQEKNTNKDKWVDKKLNIIIPCAGLGSRFANSGYVFPKPLIEVRNKPMIEVVVKNLNVDANFIYIVQKEHYQKYNLKYLLNLITPNCTIVQVDGLTEGAACTTLLAKDYINNDNPLLIANSDQFIEWDSNSFYYSLINDDIDGSILTFPASHPKWSFVKKDELGYVTEVAEKKPISNEGSVGIYAWKKGSDYVKYAESMIQKEIKVNGEYYTAPVYNEAILDGKKIKTFAVKKMFGLGIPSDLEHFLNEYKGEI
jgi:HAD superfamily hydrolase (TIGR01509 family)